MNITWQINDPDYRDAGIYMCTAYVDIAGTEYGYDGQQRIATRGKR